MYNNYMSAKMISFVIFAGLVASTAVFGQATTPIPVEEIIRRFAEKEKEFKDARANYAYRQEIKIQELSARDDVRGEYQLTMDISFDDKGRRTEKIVYAPPSTLDRLGVTPEDLQDLREIQPFVLTSDDIAKYNLKYAGKEKIDEIDCYTFDVDPKKIEKGQRYFQGKIWVDDQDFQIVKTFGKPVPDLRSKGNENLFPKFETYREQIDGYWFPTYTRALDTLDFSSGKIRIREIVRYGNYKRFSVDVKLRFGGEAEGTTGGASQDPGAPADNTAPALDPKYKTAPPAPKEDPKKK